MFWHYHCDSFGNTLQQYDFRPVFDLILKKNLKLCIDWSKINKRDYLAAMEEITKNPQRIKALLQGALTDKINDREMFMKGVDYSYYYEQEDDITAVDDQ